MSAVNLAPLIAGLNLGGAALFFASLVVAASKARATASVLAILATLSLATAAALRGDKVVTGVLAACFVAQMYQHKPSSEETPDEPR